ncbi:MAG: DUF3667 domain-containing protein [Saprospiraceae bacterium]|nr:DUF3667 domain-containing protein [Saprospiraceae bacterium]
MKRKIKNLMAVKGQKCLNCGHELINEENYCPECGQVNDSRRLSIRVFIHTMLAGFYSFDSRFFRTIVPLLFKPGKVSREYIEGKRTYYNNPFQLLLQTAIVFFLVTGLISTIKSFNSFQNPEMNGNQSTNDTIPLFDLNFNGDFGQSYSKYLDSIFKTDKLAPKFNDPGFSRKQKDSIFEYIHAEGVRYKFEDFNTKNYTVSADKIESFNAQFRKTSDFLKEYFTRKNLNYKIGQEYYRDIQGMVKDTVFSRIGFENMTRIVDFARKNEKLPVKKALDSLKLDYTQSNVFWYQKASDLNKLLYNKDFRHSYMDGIISKTTLALFLLLPFFTLFMTFIYLTSRYNYSENLVVVFNLQTVFFIILLISVMIYNLFDNRIILVILNLAYFFYVYKTLRSIYRQGRFLTMIKFMLLTMFYGFISFIGFLMISFLVFLF